MRHQGTDIKENGRWLTAAERLAGHIPILIFLLVFCFCRIAYAEPGREGGMDDPAVWSEVISPRSYPSFLEHIDGRGGRVSEELRNVAWSEVEPEEAVGPGYTWSLQATSPSGILPGTYYYELPERMHPELIGTGGPIENSIDTIGEWYTAADEDGIPVLLLTFYQNAALYQDFTGTITCSVWFEYGDDEWEEPCEESITKSGYFDPKDGCFHFTIEAEIPAYDGIEHREWRVYDYSIVSGGTWLYPRMGEMNISMEIGSSKVKITSIEEANEDTQIAFVPYTEKIEGKEYYGIYLLNRCKCTTDSGCLWIEEDTPCESLWNLDDSVEIDLLDYEGWCTCWALPKNSRLTIEYVDERTNEWIRNYGGGSYRNNADLNDLETSVNLTIPTFLTKTVTPSSGSFTSSNNFLGTYTIEVNPERYDLSEIDADGDGEADHRLVLTDHLDHLAYIPGSLEVTRVGPGGEEVQLRRGRDYDLTLTTDSTKLTGRMELVLYYPGAYAYRVTYSAQALAAKSIGVTKSGYAENTAVLHIFGGIEKNVRKRYVYSAGWDFARRELVIRKSDCEDDHMPVAGAVYGLFSQLDERIAVGTTDENGELHIRTDAAAGVILLDGEPYYVKELEAPAGYRLDESEHSIRWMGDPVIDLELTDEPEETEEVYELPLTGGSGTGPWTGGGLAVMIAAAVIYMKKRKEVMT